ncbi:MAG: FGGY family carbohydrate kinase [Actinomycetota bacterium]|nr:FGGY family carbohydrate kinase [Actinomycetota bacterium]
MTSEGPLLLGLDVGTTRTKAVLVDRAGSQRGSASLSTPFAKSAEGVEMPVEDLRAAVGRVLADLGPQRETVAAVGVAGVAESGAPHDEAGRPLGPVIAWHDPRGDETVRRLQERFGDSLAEQIGQRLRTVSSVAKLGWLVDHGTQVRRWLGVPELCLLHLSGEQATEYSLAARTGCYDVARRSWIPEVAEAAGIPLTAFPEVAGAGSVMGRVSAPGAEWSGLPAGIPVTVAGHDHLVGAVGAGAGESDLVNSVGTAETVLRRHPSPPDAGQALELKVAVSVAPAGRGWVALASGARAGVVLASAGEALGRSLSELDEMAAGAEAVEAKALLESIESGSAPSVPDAPPGAVWKGLLSALAGRTIEAVDRVVTLLGPAHRLVVFGGGSRSRPWMQAKAGASSLPVFRAATEQAVARGAAVFAGVAAGWWPSTPDAPAPPLEAVSG